MANPIDVARANLYRPEGIQLGYFAGRAFYASGDSPLVLFSGAGSGKGRDVLVYLACLYPKPMLINDPKGELAAISRRHQKQLGKSVYLINPVGLHEMEQYRLNPLDIIEIGDMLDSDCRLIAEMLIRCLPVTAITANSLTSQGEGGSHPFLNGLCSRMDQHLFLICSM